MVEFSVKEEQVRPQSVVQPAPQTGGERHNVPKCYYCGHYVENGNTCLTCGNRVSAFDKHRVYRQFRRWRRKSRLVKNGGLVKLIGLLVLLLVAAIGFYIISRSSNTPGRRGVVEFDLTLLSHIWLFNTSAFHGFFMTIAW